MKWRDTWGLSEFGNWEILKKDSTRDKLDKKLEAFELKEYDEDERRFTITPDNESEYWSLVGQYTVETSTSIPDGEYKFYHEAYPHKEEIKYYADSLVTIKNGYFDVQTVMTAFDQIVRKSKDYSHIYIEGLYPDEYGEIEIISGS